MGLKIEAAIARTSKYASRESGDSAELVERPDGGLTVVVIDGQGSGQAAKSLSSMLAARAVSLIADGVRDGAVARAVHDLLFAYRHGQVSATMDIVSFDLRSKSVLITRNSATPLLIGRGGAFDLVPCEGESLGRYLRTRPTIWEVPIETGLRVIVTTDGVATAGSRRTGTQFDLLAVARRVLGGDLGAEAVASEVLAEAVRLDEERPADDMTVVALTIQTHEERTLVRRQSAVLPLP